MSRHIPVLTIYVEDVDVAAGYYCDVLGFAVKARYGADIATLENTGSMIVLETVRAGERPRVVPGIQVEDVEGAFKDLRNKGANLIDAAPRDFPAGRCFSMRDCAGNELDILQFT